MNSLRVSLPRTRTVLFAGVILLWAAGEILDWPAPAGAAPHQAHLLLVGGVLAAPFISPALTLWFRPVE